MGGVRGEVTRVSCLKLTLSCSQNSLWLFRCFPLRCAPSKSKWRFSLKHGVAFPRVSFPLASCLYLLSILSLTSFASFCLRFRSRFFKPRRGGGRTMCVGGGGSRPCPVACPGSRQPCTCPQLNFTWGCLTPSPPHRSQLQRAPIQHSLSLSGQLLLNLSEHSNVLALL